LIAGSSQVRPRRPAEPTGQGLQAPGAGAGAGNATTRPLGSAGSRRGPGRIIFLNGASHSGKSNPLQVAAQQRLAAGQAQLAHPESREHPPESRPLLEGEQISW
jgi:hypothetical protein